MNDQMNNMKRNVINFGAGPAKLPEEVMREVQGELLEFENTKVSICELSHRSADFKAVVDDTVSTLRDILHVPSNYKIIFLQGGGQGLFASIPMNLMNLKKTNTADYIVTGSWSAKAAKEAMKYGKVNMVLPKQTQYTGIPSPSSWKLNPEASYVYYCDNETVHGIEFHHIPETNGVPLVADMSSNFLSRPFDVSKFVLVFAGAQKNFGPAGVAVVIVREDVLGNAMPICPSIFDFGLVAAENSLLNTPPAFQIWFVGKVFGWIKRNGGVEQMEKKAIAKSKKIYDVIDESKGFYKCAISLDSQSRMNIPFRINNDEALEKKFVDLATSRGMLQLKGHRSVGGIRVSLYNAITEEEAQILADYMKWFHKEYSE